VLDQAIACLERYAMWSAPPGAQAPQRSAKALQAKGCIHLAGAA